MFTADVQPIKRHNGLPDGSAQRLARPQQHQPVRRKLAQRHRNRRAKVICLQNLVPEGIVPQLCRIGLEAPPHFPAPIDQRHLRRTEPVRWQLRPRRIERHAVVDHLVDLPDGSVDRIVCNELWNDLPTKLMSRQGGDIEEEHLRPNLSEVLHAKIEDWAGFIRAKTMPDACYVDLHSLFAFLKKIEHPGFWTSERRKRYNETRDSRPEADEAWPPKDA